MQHSICLFSSGRKGPGSPTEYRTSCDRILRILRYPRYIYTAKTLYGDTGELIIEELLQRGDMTMSSTVKTVADRLTQNMEGQYHSVFTSQWPLCLLLFCQGMFVFAVVSRGSQHGLQRSVFRLLQTGGNSFSSAMPTDGGSSNEKQCCLSHSSYPCNPGYSCCPREHHRAHTRELPRLLQGASRDTHRERQTQTVQWGWRGPKECKEG